MKKILLFLVAVAFVACKPAAKEEKWREKDWLGSFSNDTTTLMLNENGMCTMAWTDSIVGGEYRWDVDYQAIVVTDRNQQVYLYFRDGKTLKSIEGSVYKKVD